MEDSQHRALHNPPPPPPPVGGLSLPGYGYVLPSHMTFLRIYVHTHVGTYVPSWHVPKVDIIANLTPASNQLGHGVGGRDSAQPRNAHRKATAAHATSAVDLNLRRGWNTDK